MSHINPPNYTILGNWVFNYFILTDEPFEKSLEGLKTCVSVDNNLFGKLILSLESAIDGRFKVTLTTFFISDFNLLSWELDNFTFKVL